MKTKKFVLKVALMDDSAEDIYMVKGLAGLRKYGESYETIRREFDTEAERHAFIEGLYAMAEGCWTTYCILADNARI